MGEVAFSFREEGSLPPVLPSKVRVATGSGSATFCRSQGKRRRQALCRRVEMKPTWNWASDNAVFTIPCRSCGTAISAPSLRLPLCRHAMFPSAFRRQVRRLTSGTFLRFPGHLCGDMRLAVAAHAHLFRVATRQHLGHQAIVVGCLITRM